MRRALLTGLLFVAVSGAESLYADQTRPGQQPRVISAPAGAAVHTPQGAEPIGPPRIGRIIIDGAERTDLDVIADLIRLAPGDVLTVDRLARASRRLSELPIASEMRMQYQPGERGSADLMIAVEEKRLLPDWWKGWAVVIGEAIFKDGVNIDIAGPLGRGEVWEVGTRWRRERPRLQLGLEIPAGRLPGVLSVEGLWERQTYRPGSTGDGPLLEERERTLGLSLADWANPGLRWQAGSGFSQFDDASFVAVQGGLERRLLKERLALMVNAGHWFSVDGTGGFSVGDISADWRSRVPTGRPMPFWTAWIGYSATTADAPLAKWPGASTGKGRNAILRAHKLLEHNVVTGEAFGRQLFFASAEYERPFYTHELGTAAFAVFADTARAWDRIYSPLPSPLHVDVGFGIRLRAPGFGGAIRMDYARGLRDGRSAVSTAWVSEWPRR